MEQPPFNGQPNQQPPYNPQQPPLQQQGQGYPQQGYPQQSYQQPPYGQPPAPQPKKKRGKGLLIAGIVVALLLFGCIVASVIAASHSTPTTSSTTSGNTGGTTQAPSGKWTTTHTFSGNGTKKTASFPVGDDWKILWTCKGMDIGGTTADSALSITINGTDNTPFDAASGTCKAGKTTSDSTEEHKGGTVYLDIIGASDWTVQVQELK